MNYEIKVAENDADQLKDEDLYMSFEIKFGPKFPVKAGATYKQLLAGLKAELPHHTEGTLVHSAMLRTIKVIEAGIQSAAQPETYLERIFEGTLWCNQGGCGSCQDYGMRPSYGKYTNCQALGQHCEVGSCRP